MRALDFADYEARKASLGLRVLSYNDLSLTDPGRLDQLLALLSERLFPSSF